MASDLREPLSSRLHVQPRADDDRQSRGVARATPRTCVRRPRWRSRSPVCRANGWRRRSAGVPTGRRDHRRRDADLDVDVHESQSPAKRLARSAEGRQGPRSVPHARDDRRSRCRLKPVEERNDQIGRPPLPMTTFAPCDSFESLSIARRFLSEGAGMVSYCDRDGRRIPPRSRKPSRARRYGVEAARAAAPQGRGWRRHRGRLSRVGVPGPRAACHRTSRSCVIPPRAADSSLRLDANVEIVRACRSRPAGRRARSYATIHTTAATSAAITSVFPIRRSTTPSMSDASLSSPSTEAPHRTQTAS